MYGHAGVAELLLGRADVDVNRATTCKVPYLNDIDPEYSMPNVDKGTWTRGLSKFQNSDIF